MATRPDTEIDEIVDGIYRIATWAGDDVGITMNQFLIDDERPALIHTGVYQQYEGTRDAISKVMDPGKLEFVALLHFESDENGGMDRFLEGAPDSTLIGSELSMALNVSAWNFQGRFQGFKEGEVLDLGKHKLRFLETPHVHHWDSMMLFDETTKSIFPSDLYIQPGPQPPKITENMSDAMIELYKAVGIFAHEKPVRDVVDRLEALDADWMHSMHGGSITGDAIPYYTQALREKDFAYQGMLLGRQVLDA